MKKPQSICIFGDSVSWGAWDMAKGGWVNRLWFYLAKREGDNYVEVYNCSISGATTDTLLACFESEAKVRSADALIFQIGGNDAGYEHTPDNYLVEHDEFASNLEEIIRRAKMITTNIVFADLKNCDESRTTPVPWIDIYYTNKNIQKYHKIMEGVCRRNDVYFLELRALDKGDFDDGLHPNMKGHEKIFIQVRDFLVSKGWV